MIRMCLTSEESPKSSVRWMCSSSFNSVDGYLIGEDKTFRKTNSSTKKGIRAYSGRAPASPDSVQVDFDKPVKVRNSLSENDPIKLFLVDQLHPLCHRMFGFRPQRDFIPLLDHRFCWLPEAGVHAGSDSLLGLNEVAPALEDTAQVLFAQFDFAFSSYYVCNFMTYQAY
jgi:hypothetical protein